MPAYYVRASMGNDGNTGLSPAQAWLTLDNAANNVAAADLVHIGAGVYREIVTMDVSGTHGNKIIFRGDTTGEHTGDPGWVLVSAHNANNAGAARVYCLDFNEKEFIEWHNVIFLGGTGPCVYSSGAAHLAYEGVVFQSCVLVGGHLPEDRCARFDVNQGATPTYDGLQFLECVFLGEFLVFHTNNAVAHVDLKWDFKNCLCFGHAAYYHFYFFHDGSASTYSIGGVTIANSILWGAGWGVCGVGLRDVSNPVRGVNNLVSGHSYGFRQTAGVAGGMWEDYNIAYRLTLANLASGGTASGGNSDANAEFPVMGGLCDPMMYFLLGWSPVKPWEPFSSAVTRGFASAAYAPDNDLYNNPRPMGRNTDDVGPVEGRVRPVLETVTVPPSWTSSGAFSGASYMDEWRSVDAALTTVTVAMRYDGNYAGNLPLVEVLDMPNLVADTNTVMAAAADTWEDVVVTFTPTATGWVRVRIRSRDTSANGVCYFGNIRMSP